jgi:acyl carrier protein
MVNVLSILEKIRPEHDFTESTDFISDGLLDSFDIVTLVTEFENRFKISIDGADVTPENFNNLEALEQFLRRCLKGNES